MLHELEDIDSVLIAYNYHPLNVTAREHIIPTAAAKGVAVVVAGLFTFVNALPAAGAPRARTWEKMPTSNWPP